MIVSILFLRVTFHLLSAMVFIKNFEEGSITVLDRNSDGMEAGTTIRTHKPLDSLLSDPNFKPIPEHWTSLTRHCVIRDSEPDRTSDTTVLTLRGFGRSAEPMRRSPFLTRIGGPESWKPTLSFPGELRYTPLYWEWTEDILSRFKDVLNRQGLYDAVFASLFLYNHCPAVIKAFCDTWCSSSNSAFTSKGKVSFSLLDLHSLSGLPCFGEVLDEVVPTIDELNETKPVNGIHHCRYLLYAFHKLSKRNPGSSVKVLFLSHLVIQKSSIVSTDLTVIFRYLTGSLSGLKVPRNTRLHPVVPRKILPREILVLLALLGVLTPMMISLLISGLLLTI